MKYLKIYESFVFFKKTQAACDFIINKLNDDLDDKLHYHNVGHTIQMMNSVKTLCEMENIDDETSNLLYVAGAYHDSGFLMKYKNNEPEGAKIAEMTLTRYGFTTDEIQKIKRFIMATEHSFIPTTIEEKIMKDADLSYLGSNSEYQRQSDELRQEWVNKNIVYSDSEWNELQIKFLKSHTFYTDSAKKLWDSNKQENLNSIS
jgi:predicted metal-dependent HD superfamily phosphohydrolase